MMKKISAYALAALILVTPIFSNAATKDIDGGKLAYQHVVELSNNIGDRTQTTDGEYKAKDYIEKVFKDAGYVTQIQSFEINRTKDDQPYDNVTSNNVIATKPGQSKKQIIVGAHYDSKNDAATGADDNASGVAVMLETAQKIAQLETQYTVKFIAFGAEESFKNADEVKNGGLNGSSYYAENMSQDEVDNTIAMINLDSLLAGDNMYVYGDLGKKGFVRDQTLEISKELGLNIETNPGKNSEYPAGTTGDWSDHAPFMERGIPYGYFEATNWLLGDMDGYTQTEKHGEIWHTEKDTLQFLEKEFPGRVDERFMSFSNALTQIVLNLNPVDYSTFKITMGKNEIMVNDSSQNMIEKPFIQNGRSFMTIDSIEKLLNVDVKVSDNKKQATLTKNDKSTISNLIFSDNGTSFISINDVATLLNGSVQWYSSDKAVEVVY